MSKKILVAYFSASGVTAKAAKALAEAAGADLYEITPEKPYTREDLNWNDKKSRSSVEMDDKTSRPAIAGNVADMSQYQTLFVGFPIWLAYHNLFLHCLLYTKKPVIQYGMNIFPDRTFWIGIFVKME